MSKVRDTAQMAVFVFSFLSLSGEISSYIAWQSPITVSSKRG